MNLGHENGTPRNLGGRRGARERTSSDIGSERWPVRRTNFIMGMENHGALGSLGELSCGSWGRTSMVSGSERRPIRLIQLNESNSD